MKLSETRMKPHIWNTDTNVMQEFIAITIIVPPEGEVVADILEHSFPLAEDSDGIFRTQQKVTRYKVSRIDFGENGLAMKIHGV